MEKEYTRPTDEELLGYLRDHDDRVALEVLSARYSIRIFVYIHTRVNDRYTAREIVQELFVSLWQERQDLSVQICRAYLFSAAQNCIVTHYRKEMARVARKKNWEAERPHEEAHIYQKTIVQVCASATRRGWGCFLKNASECLCSTAGADPIVK